jgi:hypothetical protein
MPALAANTSLAANKPLSAAGDRGRRRDLTSDRGNVDDVARSPAPRFISCRRSVVFHLSKRCGNRICSGLSTRDIRMKGRLADSAPALCPWRSGACTVIFTALRHIHDRCASLPGNAICHSSQFSLNLPHDLSLCRSKLELRTRSRLRQHCRIGRHHNSGSGRSTTTFLD